MSDEDKKEIAQEIITNTIFCMKEMLTADEAAKYLGMKKSYLYQLTMSKEIPFYKPTGKLIYFKRVELEEWLQKNRVATEEELSQQAQSYCMKRNFNHK